MKDKRFHIQFGAMCPTLADQFRKQGQPYPPDLDQYQKDADAIVRLVVRGLITDSECHKARTRLMKRLTR